MRKKYCIIAWIFLFTAASIAYAAKTEIMETSAEVFVDTGNLKVNIWKTEFTGGRISIQDDSGNSIKIASCFNFGNNSFDGNNIPDGLDNSYSMYLNKGVTKRIKDLNDRVIVELDFPESQITYRYPDRAAKPLSKDVFSAKVNVVVYKYTKRVDILARQNLKDDIYTHVGFFQQFGFSPFGKLLFGTEPDLTEITPKTWSNLRFMYKTPGQKILFIESAHDEKPPFTTLKESEKFKDFWVIIPQATDEAIMVYSPSWQRYASLGFNRRDIPNSCIFFDAAENLSGGRIVTIIKDTTLGAGMPVMKLDKGEYLSEIKLLFVPKTIEPTEYLKEYKTLIK